MCTDNTAIPGDIRMEAEHASSPESVNTTVGQQDTGSIAAWGSNHATNTTVPTASLYWRGEVHDDSKNSHKFYTVIVTGSFVMRTWGRIAGYGRKATERSKPEEFNSEEEAIASANSTILKKCARGYDTVEVNQ
jgi:predicted DNA-binding WGR domain protein